MIYPIFALTTRGLEDVTQRELALLPSIHDTQTAYRRVTAQAADLRALAALRTADDVFLQVASWADLTHTRQALHDVRDYAAQLELEPTLTALRDLRPIETAPLFSVTVNFVGRRNTSAPELKTALAKGVLDAYPDWTYTDDDASAQVNLRAFIDHADALVGVRLGERPLYRRAYKQAHLPGSLKPSVAAALLSLLEAAPGATLLDPFCGSGT
ncbi:MAG: hypothetical protein H7Y11_04955, partial [Armatimonadetes bacterium]|nr:hypothetical protein [Anaerolineae bacterium]